MQYELQVTVFARRRSLLFLRSLAKREFGGNMRRLVICCLPLILVAGCAGRVNKVMQSWENVHYSDLIMSWGPPQAVYADGQGGRILVYTAQRQWVTPATATTTTTASATAYDNYIWGQAESITTFNPAQLRGYTAYRMFQINSAGRIVNWSWRGL
jgi:hypothetical protein